MNVNDNFTFIIIGLGFYILQLNPLLFGFYVEQIFVKFITSFYFYFDCINCWFNYNLFFNFNVYMVIMKYFKWVATGFLLLGMALASFNVYPYYLFFLCLGSFSWLIVALYWKEYSLVLLDGIATAIYIIGILHRFI